MKLGAVWKPGLLDEEAAKTAHAAVATALDVGVTLFDHADIYCCGRSEAAFARVLAAAPGLRERIIIQSKCGIRFAGDMLRSEGPARYDFSYDHIVRSVEGSLRRLGVDVMDILLLHRPDPLLEPGEVARAFDDLHAAGKVRHFGVSNHSVWQMELLRKYLRQPIVINQLEFSLAQPALVVEGTRVNQVDAPKEAALADGVLDYCRLHSIRVQAWGPLGAGKLSTGPVAKLAKEMADLRGVAPEAILVAWILRHPAGIQPILGSLRPERIRAAACADGVALVREEWYQLLEAARGTRIP
jgi:predicted oxidoreductase